MPATATAQINRRTRQLVGHLDRLTYAENFQKRPALNAVIGLPGSDSTSPTAAALAAFTIANRDFEVLGVNMTTALATFAAGGGVTLTTAGASADSSILLPHLDTTQTAWASTTWGTGDEVACAAKIVSGASIASATIYYGLKLTNTDVVITDNDQAYFRYQDSINSGKWQAVYSVGNTDYTLDTGITVAASTAYKLEIDIDANRVPRFYIDNELVATGTAMTASTNLIPYVGVLAGTAAAKAITVRPGYSISKNI